MGQGDILVILSILVGISFILVSFFLKDKKVKESNTVENIIPVNQMHTSNDQREEDMMKEVNQKILELNDYASFIKKEISDQHKELLFLYQLITEKEKNFKSKANNVALSGSKPVIHKQDNRQGIKQVEQTSQDNVKQLTTLNDMIVERNKEIFDLYKQGLSITEIAKGLNIGKGEVKLILDLGTR